MKHFWCFALCATAAAALIPEKDRVNGENGWFVPKRNGSFEWIWLQHAETYLQYTSMSLTEGRHSLNTVKFYLFTKTNPYEGQEIFASKESIISSYFNSKNPTILTIHGWTSSYTDFLNKGVRKAFLYHGDHNMIAIDWARARSVDYASSVLAASGAGEKIAAFLKLLAKYKGMDFKSVKIVGHSLGAHVAGYAGKSVKPEKLGSIIGCDPALPLFSFNKPNKRLASTDANYVETIQTNGGKMGFQHAIGKAAFYPNGGKFQPGCGKDLNGSCAHGRSVTYYIESIYKNNFISLKCSSYKEAVSKNCGSTYSSTRLGDPKNENMVVDGSFYVPINNATPYGML